MAEPYFKTDLGELYCGDAWQLLREFPNKPAMPKSERTPHPTQKPVGLIEHLVKGWSHEGDLVRIDE